MSGIQEKVLRARSSSNLKSEGHIDRDVDVLAACGWADRDESAGAAFSRLRGEFDEVHATMKRLDPLAGAIDLRLATITRLRTLTEARFQASEVAVTIAERTRVDIKTMHLQNVIWQALSIWMDPTCGHCGGTGGVGGYDGSVRNTCGQCKGSGKRRDTAGKSPEEHRFISSLTMAFDECMGRFHGRADARLR